MENPTKLQLEMRKEWIPKAMLKKVMVNLQDIESRVKVSGDGFLDVWKGCLFVACAVLLCLIGV